MPDELVKASSVSVPAIGGGQSLPVLVEHAGPAARFAWDEFFYAEHHNPQDSGGHRTLGSGHVTPKAMMIKPAKLGSACPVASEICGWPHMRLLDSCQRRV